MGIRPVEGSIGLRNQRCRPSFASESLHVRIISRKFELETGSVVKFCVADLLHVDLEHFRSSSVHVEPASTVVVPNRHRLKEIKIQFGGGFGWISQTLLLLNLLKLPSAAGADGAQEKDETDGEIHVEHLGLGTG